MGNFLLSKNRMLPELRLCDEFIGDGLANEKGGFKCELVKVEERNGKQAVNARELHQKLGCKKKFVDWMKYRIEQYGFVENQDFEVFHNFGKNSNGGRPTDVYAISLDMAKELCMVENNDAGRRIRKYFIDMENEARKLMMQQSAVPSYQEVDPIKRATRWIEEEKQRQALMLENKRKQEALEASQREVVELSSTITQMQPKVTYFDVMIKNKSTCVITSMAQDYGMSAVAFNKKLNELGIQHKVADQWVLYRQYLDKGYVNSEPVTITHNDGSQTIKYNTKWTQRGRFFLYDFLKSKGILPLIEQHNYSVAQN